MVSVSQYFRVIPLFKGNFKSFSVVYNTPLGEVKSFGSRVNQVWLVIILKSAMICFNKIITINIDKNLKSFGTFLSTKSTLPVSVVLHCLTF